MGSSDRESCRCPLKATDIAVVQANNFVERHPTDPLMDLRPRLPATLPEAGEPIVTCAYPENAIFD